MPHTFATFECVGERAGPSQTWVRRCKSVPTHSRTGNEWGTRASSGRAGLQASVRPVSQRLEPASAGGTLGRLRIRARVYSCRARRNFAPSRLFSRRHHTLPAFRLCADDRALATPANRSWLSHQCGMGECASAPGAKEDSPAFQRWVSMKKEPESLQGWQSGRDHPLANGSR